MTTPLLSVKNLSKTYRGPGGKDVLAVRGVSFDLAPREILGLVGESGSGKSTTGRLVLRLEDATTGEITFNGQRIDTLPQRALRPVRREMQVVFQDPYAALNPRMTVGKFVSEPMEIHKITAGRTETRDRVADLFKQVGLDPSFMDRYPHEFSGGQRQRINIARAISISPKLIVADEPITALDVSIQAQIVNLFSDLQEQLGLAYLFVAHDLAMVRFLCHRVAVMLRGRIVEIAPTESLFQNAQHPYTQALISAIPIPDPARERARRALSYTPDEAALSGELREVSPGHFVLQA
ncbi:peptide ABC transporter ATP-binding protein (plasmid) [Ketogulonicigenium vulgare Y25]|uniref:Oligopeptide/dipeptide ABC transporter, ATPase subunit n=1 Tax=Ketogulonicigenium vulgare (strain WSH-001) TaxID=759362 RepID=F9YBV9_KETVW|nr:ATP-binding cassette domain-containing protein [Ketogulonicigenium vulgare]ADO44208.1 peptide ABC transporter ATP-binding protein [Ketogulonicigenium vulgare Y25]AEM42861.1 oligopeptide/dipeptide ABC transporter, ATPase subunit [Ketogulonicigenium vulgare WSH-001]ALJ82712.1 dipeptide/oligopeptide/nickel ABC transporter ATP-binding protein [Ketogulonicigenium vulgare]